MFHGRFRLDAVANFQAAHLDKASSREREINGITRYRELVSSIVEAVGRLLRIYASRSADKLGKRRFWKSREFRCLETSARRNEAEGESRAGVAGECERRRGCERARARSLPFVPSRLVETANADDHSRH